MQNSPSDLIAASPSVVSSSADFQGATELLAANPDLQTQLVAVITAVGGKDEFLEKLREA